MSSEPQRYALNGETIGTRYSAVFFAPTDTDIGVGSLVNAWGFGPTGQEPDAQQICALGQRAQRPASEVLEVDRALQHVQKKQAITLHLSGIAKGFGVDALARALDRFGITRYLVGINGQAWAWVQEK